MKKFLFPYELIKKDSDILIFGAGYVGRQYLQAIEKTGYCNVKYVLDNNYKELSDAKLPLGVKVVAPEFAMQCKNYSAVLIAVKYNDMATKIKRQLLILGVENDKIIFTKENAVEFIEDNGAETLRIAFLCSGGLGDDIAGVLLPKGMREIVPKNLVLDYYCRTYQLLENLDFIDNAYHISQFTGNDKYDIVLTGHRAFEIEKLALTKVKRISEKLYQYFVDILDIYENILNFEDISTSHRFLKLCEILNKSFLEQCNIHDILPFNRNTKLQLNLSIDIENYIKSLNLKNKQFITICENDSSKNNYDIRFWHPQNFLALCDMINKDFPDKIIIWIGNSITTDISSKLDNPRIIDLRGKTSLTELAALLKCAELHIGLESGPIHLRHFLDGGTSVCLFGPTSISTLAYDENINIRSSKYPCSENGCMLVHKKFPHGACLISPKTDYSACMEALSPQEVHKCIYDYLNAQNGAKF
ncbi:MAG: hypothetical protein FWC15_03180 [Fibromonadales bacterium]|nr:hypothetical protein [Fibromonadales bacterium]